MQGYNDGRLRLRVGKYRVIYRYDVDNELKILYIIDIGSRGDIYIDMSKTQRPKRKFENKRAD